MNFYKLKKNSRFARSKPVIFMAVGKVVETPWLKGKRRRIAELLVQGIQEKEIARILNLSLSSIKKHIVILKDKAGCQSLHGLSACLGVIFVLKGQLKIEPCRESILIKCLNKS